MIMYGVYNVDMLERLIQMVHKMNNRSIWYERLYARHVNKWFEMYLASQSVNYYAIHSLLHLRTKYYDMKLVTFGIDQNRNLIIQFPIFVQPYTQKPLTLYQVETIPVLIVDMNKRADSYMWIRIDKPYITLNPDTYISI